MLLWADLLFGRVSNEALPPTERRAASSWLLFPECLGNLAPVPRCLRRIRYVYLVETQRFGAPDVVHNMRRSGLSMAAPDVYRARREGYSPPILTILLRSVGTSRLHEAAVGRNDL